MSEGVDLNKWKVGKGESRVVIPGNDIDIGITARGNKTGVVAVDLGMGADPVTFTHELVREEKLKQGCVEKGDGTWKLSAKFRREYLRDPEAYGGAVVFDPDWIDWLSPHLKEPLYEMELDLTPVVMTEAEARAGLPVGFEIGRDAPRTVATIDKAPRAVWRKDNGVVVLGSLFWRWDRDAKRRELSKWLVLRPGGRVKVWIDPHEIPSGLTMDVESAWRTFGIGADVGEGVGQSDTTAEVLTGDTREQAAEFADNRVTPGDFGRVVSAMARYFNMALVCPVRKMHGITVIRTMCDECDYWKIWRSTDPAKAQERKVESLGWGGGEISDLLLGRLRDAMEHKRITIHSSLLIQQMKGYVFDSVNRMCHQTVADSPMEVRDRHGDRVIGLALAWRAVLDLPKWSGEVKKDDAPYGSLNYRLEKAGVRNKRKKDSPWFMR